MNDRNFVPPAPVQAPRAEILRREDILEAQRALLATYSAQQNAILSDVQDDVRSGRYTSDAHALAERRRTSALYLMLYATCSGAGMAGLTVLGVVWVGVPGSTAVAAWLAGTALATIALSWYRHGQELHLSPEGIAHSLLDWHGTIALMEAETRRELLRREHDLALLDRQTAADAAAAQRQLAADLAAARRPQTPQAPQTFVPTEYPTTPVEAPTNVSTGVGGHSGGAALLDWAATLHEGGLSEDGIVLGRVPWAARSPWPAEDKALALRICVQRRPSLFEQAAGGRWRLRTDVVSDGAQLLAILAQRL